MVSERQLRLHIVEIGRKLYKYRYIVATDGNISARLNDKIIITPAGVCKGTLKADDLLVVDTKGEIIRGSGKASSEFRMHLEVYKVRPDVAAVVHAHPVYATSFASCGIAMVKPVLPEIILTLKKVPLAAYATPGTNSVSKSISEIIKEHDGILLENHGVLTVAKNLDQAYMHLERIEHAAQIIYQASQMCSPRVLSTDELSALKKIQ